MEGVQNPCFSYNTYLERVREREQNESAHHERERQSIRNRSLSDYNLEHLQQSVILIPLTVETNENVLQDNTVSSTTNEMESVNLRLWSFFKSLFSK